MANNALTSKPYHGAIYDADPDALPKLRQKLVDLVEARSVRARVNKIVRKHGIDHESIDPEVRAYLRRLHAIVPYHNCLTRGFPAYESQNLSGNIARVRERIANLERAAGTTRATVEAV